MMYNNHRKIFWSKIMNFNDIAKEYAYMTELHAHTSPVSGCADFSPEDVMATYAAAGVHSVVITNHLTPDWIGKSADEYLDDFYRAKRAGESLGVNAILGVEIRFTENNNDYLVFGVKDSDISAMVEYLESGIHVFYSEFKREDNLIIQAHPFRKHIVEIAPDDVDGYETFNLHPGHNSGVGFSSKLARETGKLATCGTDYHHRGHERMALLRTKNELCDSFDVARAIGSKDYLFDIWGHLVYPYGN